ncbi:hypothetical protein LSUE1_G009209 [Lachnellula suecica]|uniref:F-box domain-containing protein n=1 Tax=Lachnellula suecica TaxID=602035 RepID=A0A8T9BTW2_9HELO|nr:hypothetical protein LSUE1_G009209 [Lachnellula suecica]
MDPPAPRYEDMPAPVITLQNNDTFVWGRHDFVDESFHLIEAVERPTAEVSEKNHDALPSSDDGESSSPSAVSYPATTDSSNNGTFIQSSLLYLPSELIDHVLSFLGPPELANVSSTCHLLSVHAKSDPAWVRHVQENVHIPLTSPYPCETYRELYISHDPHWFLSKYKLWFCDQFLTGKLVIGRYDPRRGCIEGYRLLAERPPPTFTSWEEDDEVVIHSFNPQCRLHLDQPVFQLNAHSLQCRMESYRSRPGQRFKDEIPMQLNKSNQGVYSNLLLARPVQELPGPQLWPPPTIPARQRVKGSAGDSLSAAHRPNKRSEVSTQAFRIRRWMEMTGQNGSGIHLGEETSTYATLDPKIYTPTEDKPYRGIWVGDFSGHGCEFLLINQPDDDEPFDEASVIQRVDETFDEWELRKKEERIYRGSLEAIKLTGDPNIPRGQYTFVADDISEEVYVERTATEARFKGARFVKSRGHVAQTMFRDGKFVGLFVPWVANTPVDKYVETQLIMISHNRLAQYWVAYGHISYYERVDIDQFLSPFNDPPPKPLATKA